MDGYQASSKKNQVQICDMKEMSFLLSADQKRYSFLLKQLMDGDNVGRDEYTITTTLESDLLIRKEGGIRVNHKYSTYENRRNRGGRHKKECMGLTFNQRKGETEDSTTLFPG